MSSKPRIVKDYEKLDISIQEQLKLNYPYGFDKYLITFKNAKGAFVSALPYEADDYYYLIRMTRAEARDIILEDDDYDDGMLKDEVKAEYEEKYESDDDDFDVEDIEDEDVSTDDD
jgi:hypothetical protein